MLQPSQEKIQKFQKKEKQKKKKKKKKEKFFSKLSHVSFSGDAQRYTPYKVSSI
ncbi:Uncharacterized protein APZ42_015248 [Daphnia magna]|uniref:Uncharacterized protein n=1 Tax=Daphnia magna TaxID=35525 RepID=A0A162PAP5_9CRUS|nr:Uncharacterized protein APZ42_015248 [Daphnia magna]